MVRAEWVSLSLSTLKRAQISIPSKLKSVSWNSHHFGKKFLKKLKLTRSILAGSAHSSESSPMKIVFPNWLRKNHYENIMTTLKYNILGKLILVTDSKIHVCEESALEIFSLSRKGFSLSNFVSKFVCLFLNLFLTPEIRSIPKIAKTFTLDDYQGRLKFTWEKYIITKPFDNTNVSESDYLSRKPQFIEKQNWNWL